MDHYVNVCTLGGDIVRAPVLTFYPDGCQCVFSLMVRNYNPVDPSGNQRTFITVKARGKLAEHVQAHLPAGSAIIVVGDLRLQRWTDAEGKSRQSHCLFARQIHSLTFGSAKAAKRRVPRPDGEIGGEPAETEEAGSAETSPPEGKQ